MHNFLSTYIKGDKVIWMIYIIMIVASSLTMYSASSSLIPAAIRNGGSYYSPVWSHVLFLIGGLLVVFVVHRIPFRLIIVLVKPAYIVSLILLFLTPLIGVEVNGARRWISVCGILFQTSEIVKVCTVLFLACVLAKCQNLKDKTPDSCLLTCLLILAVPFVLISMDNLSTGILLLCIWFLMLFYARVSMKLILKLAGVIVVCACLGLTFLWYVPETPSPTSPASIESVEAGDGSAFKFRRLVTWKHRIFTKDEQPHDANYKIQDVNFQKDHAKIAVANGKWFGLGIGNSIQRDFLPLAFADYIFSLMIEEVGFFALFILILYLMFLFRVGVLVKKYCNSVVQALIVLGLSSMIVVQTYINVFIAVDLFPVSGQPLPLFSRGGTSILITSFYFGIILCVSKTAMEKDSTAQEITKNKTEEKSVGTKE